MKAIWIFLALLFLSTTACKDDVITGCTDERASNYDPLATEENRTCSYYGAAVFYNNQSTSQNLLNDGISSLKYYVSGSIQGSYIANLYWDPVPDCDSDSAVTIPMRGLGLNPTQNFGYQVRDQDDNILETGSFLMTGNECTKIEFVYN